jgi:hypothetical protein
VRLGSHQNEFKKELRELARARFVREVQPVQSLGVEDLPHRSPKKIIAGARDRRFFMTVERLIFTDDLIARARAQPEARRSLIHRWAVFEGPAREAARYQLDAAASLVPPSQRARVLGLLHSNDDKQVMAAAGVLLLAKVLGDHGWLVEHEPSISGGTPDLRIQKGQADFLVEIRRVVGDLGVPTAYPRLRAALTGIQTKTPASFTAIEVDGGASLKRFRAFLLQVLSEKRIGPQVFAEPGVLIRFELHHHPREHETEVIFSYCAREEMITIDERPKVRAALDEKLRKYRFPLIVALQGIDEGDLFRAAEDELFGSVVCVFPTGQAEGSARTPWIERQSDSAVVRPDSNGDRVRARLEALLPFVVNITGQGFAVRARLLANPAKPGVAGLEEFRPIPSVLHLGSTRMGYVGAEGKPLGNNEEIVDEFIP